MRIKKENVHRYDSSKQIDYNMLARQAVSSILQTENEDPIGYVNARMASGSPRGYVEGAAVRHILRTQIPLSDEDKSEYPIFREFGMYERVVFSSLIKGDYNAIVLVGDRGSGKTATAKRIKQCLLKRTKELCKLCQKCRGPKVLHINFNLGYREVDVAQLKLRLYEQLYDMLNGGMFDLLGTEEIAKDLPRYIVENRTDQHCSAFYPWAVKSNRPSDPQRMIESIMEHVNTYADNVGRKVELLMTLVRYYSEEVAPNPACFVMIFDNLDSVIPEAQHELFDIILSIRAIGRARALVPLRWATFEQNKGAKAFAYDIIIHRGPDIRLVLEARLRFYQENWSSAQHAPNMPPEFADALQRRIGLLLRNEDASRAKDLLLWTSGDCVRCGLLSAVRLFVNTTVPFDAANIKPDALARCLLVGNDKQQIMDTRDPHILNIVADKLSGSFTLLNLRILQLIFAFEGVPEKRRVSTLSKMLSSLNIWSDREIRQSLEQLLLLDRALIWVDSRSCFVSDTDIFQDHSVVYLTAAGELYFIHCLRDLTYMQESLMSVIWSPVHIQMIEGLKALPEGYDYSLLNNRFRVLRACLAAMLNEDAFETFAFQEWLSATPGEPSLDLQFISGRIIYSLSKSTFYILTSARIKFAEDKETLLFWLDLVTNAYNEEHLVLHMANVNLASIIGRYRKYLDIEDYSEESSKYA